MVQCDAVPSRGYCARMFGAMICLGIIGIVIQIDAHANAKTHTHNITRIDKCVFLSAATAKRGRDFNYQRAIARERIYNCIMYGTCMIVSLLATTIIIIIIIYTDTRRSLTNTNNSLNCAACGARAQTVQPENPFRIEFVYAYIHGGVSKRAYAITCKHYVFTQRSNDCLARTCAPAQYTVIRRQKHIAYAKHIWGERSRQSGTPFYTQYETRLDRRQRLPFVRPANSN